jgi:hypothetical protein
MGFPLIDIKNNKFVFVPPDSEPIELAEIPECPRRLCSAKHLDLF